MFEVYITDGETQEIERVKSILEQLRNDFEVTGFDTDIEKAVKDIICLHPDLVIFDWMMSWPKMSGSAMMRKVQDAGIGCEFITLASSWSVNSVRKFYHSGGLDYLRKPLEAPETTICFKSALDTFARKRETIKRLPLVGAQQSNAKICPTK